MSEKSWTEEHKREVKKFKRLREKLALFFGKQEKFVSRSTVLQMWMGSVFVPQGSVILNYKEYVVIVKRRRNEKKEPVVVKYAQRKQN